MNHQLWFDVERRYKTMVCAMARQRQWLWFDVERRYKTIAQSVVNVMDVLWFDVERRYKTIEQFFAFANGSCGLM